MLIFYTVKSNWQDRNNHISQAETRYAWLSKVITPGNSSRAGMGSYPLCSDVVFDLSEEGKTFLDYVGIFQVKGREHQKEGILEEYRQYHVMLFELSCILMFSHLKK